MIRQVHSEHMRILARKLKEEFYFSTLGHFGHVSGPKSQTGPKIKIPVQQFFGPWVDQQSLKKWKAYLKNCGSSSNLTKFGHTHTYIHTYTHTEGRQNGRKPVKITATASNAVALKTRKNYQLNMTNWLCQKFSFLPKKFKRWQGFR